MTMTSEPTREPDRPIPQTQSGENAAQRTGESGAPVAREAPLRDVLLALAQADAALLVLMDAAAIQAARMLVLNAWIGEIMPSERNAR